ncbi:kinase/pyrophosphorylase [Paenibacillus sp. TRM 82003]|nr:kinase/pyrophosphorylase [Paenibacillus sp. TRM 82003]
MTDHPGYVYVCSDSVGETAEAVARATLRQFQAEQVRIKRFANLREEAEITALLEEAVEANAFVAYTLVQPELREAMKLESMRLGLRTVDIMGPMIQAYVDTFNDAPKRVPGLLHVLDDEYFKRVEAIEFAVRCDDGREPASMQAADIVILGVSRTSKTPLSIYLAHKGLKVSNLPLVPEARLPEELARIAPDKLIGLTAEAESIARIRSERLKVVGLPFGAVYADPQRVAEELAYAQDVMKRHGCYVIDVSNRAIEETAGLIMDYIHG